MSTCRRCARFGFELRYGHHLSAARLCAGIYIAALEGSVWAQGKLLERFGLPAELWPRVRHRLRRTADGRVISRTERAAIDERRRRAMH